MELKVIGELMVGIEVMAHKFIILEKDGAGFQVENKRVLKKYIKKTKNVFQDELSSIIQVLQKKRQNFTLYRFRSIKNNVIN